MKLKEPVGPAVFLGVYLAAACLMAQGEGGPPPPNINEGGNPTSAAQRPAETAPTPTYPSGRNQPPSRGGTLGHDPDLDDEEVRERRAREARRRRRTVPESEAPTHTGSDPAQPSLPTQRDVDEPGALEGGPQP
jgi:hypothetical protein